MKLSVVIVNYNVKYFLELCLHSLFRAIDTIEVEVFVVDNASKDDSLNYLKERFPQVQYISNSENVGFSKANNQAIRRSQGEYVLLLNPDVVIAEDTLKECLEFMDKHPLAGGVGVEMINGTGEFLPESKRGIPTPLSSFLYLSGLNKLLPRSCASNGYQLNHLDKNEIHQVSVLAGAFMMIRKSALDKCGLLAEEFFMYGEDIDLSCRIKQAGFENYYLPLPIIHFKGESTNKNSYQYRHNFSKSMYIFFNKYGVNYSKVFKSFVNLGLKSQYLIAMGQLRLQLKLVWMKVAWTNFKNKLVERFKINSCVDPNKFLLITRSKKSAEELCVKYKETNIFFNKLELDKADYLLYKDQLMYSKKHLSNTHLVFCYDEFTFKEIINFLSSASTLNLQIGFCSKKTKVIITPHNIIPQ